jgi:CelD/BcsL family acetyltransferase involved in cellulose biosynthesis
MTIRELDPLVDSRWATLVAQHTNASVFHTTEWLQALQQTYGYQPVAFTTSAPEAALEDGVVFCAVRSWLTGRRLVSLPFSDHCEPLVADSERFGAMARHLDRVRRDGDWGYIELRPRTEVMATAPDVRASERFWFHHLDLRPSEHALFNALHKDSIQRKIHRADREGLAYEEGRDEHALGTFYELLKKTRQRHQLPPQPLQWFRNLAGAFGASMTIRIARHGDRAIAAIVTLRHQDTMVYKYGASDDAFHPLGGMHLLLWKTIQMARAAGCTMLDLGRCDIDNHGLATFKERWGATRSELIYWQYAPRAAAGRPLRKFAIQGVKRALDHAPAVCRTAAGRFLYRHAG